jgi:hypothetical protein
MGRMNRLLAGGALAVFLAAMAAIAVASLTSGGGGSSPNTTSAAGSVATKTATTAATQTRPAATRPIALTGAGAYDPEGDQHENDDLAPLAVDGDTATFWKTEHYLHAFSKSGVGLLLDAGKRTTFSRVFVGTDASGSSARIEVGDTPSGPFRAVSAERPLTGTTAFAIRKGAAGRYLVVWITSLPQGIGEAHVTEVRALGG